MQGRNIYFCFLKNFAAPEQTPRTPKTTDTLGLRPRIKTLAKTIIENHHKWLAVQSRGLTICTQIDTIKRQALEECKHDSNKSAFPDELVSPCSKFKVILTILDDVLAAARDTVRQLDAIVKLNNPVMDGVVLRSWNLERVQLSAERLVQVYEKELPIRRKVMQEIAHSRTKEELILHQSVWEFPVFVNERTIGFEVICIAQECDFEIGLTTTPVKQFERNKQ